MRLLLLLPAIFGIDACQGDETARAYGAGDREWTLIEVNEVAFDARATLRFPAAGKIAGDGPCNSYVATMTVPYPWFDAGLIASTRLACPALDAEVAFLAALGQATLIEVGGDTLILSNPDGLKMVFTAAD